MISVQDLTKTYQMGKNTFEALKGVSFEIQSGEVVAIIGPSGSGKSTTMQLLGLLDHPTSGTYRLDGEDTATLTPNQRANVRNQKIGFIFQSFYLLSRLTALQNVALPLTYAKVSGREIKERAVELLEKVGMGDHMNHKPTELSGGQQQRVAIARALVGRPNIILADEPTGALDTKTSEVVLELMLSQAKGTTVVIITHDKEVAARCERVLFIRDGLIHKDERN